MALNLNRYNERVRTWAKDSILKMQSEAYAMNVQHRKGSPSKSASLPKIRDRYKERDGGIERVSILFPRTLIYTHKGAGKGRGGLKGSRWTDRFGVTRTTNPNSLGKMGTQGRKAKPFFNNVLDGRSGVEELADIVAEETGDIIINELFIK